VEAGELVIVGGVQKVRPGMMVQPVMAGRPADAPGASVRAHHGPHQAGWRDRTSPRCTCDHQFVGLPPQPVQRSTETHLRTDGDRQGQSRHWFDSTASQ